MGSCMGFVAWAFMVTSSWAALYYPSYWLRDWKSLMEHLDEVRFFVIESDGKQ